MSVRRLVIDIGTNSVLALLADVTDGQLEIISDRKATTRLGEGLSATGVLSQAAMKRTADAIIEFVKNSGYDELIMIGTEALRIARNSSEFIEMVDHTVGQQPVIISGLKEAELSFLGALYNLKVAPENILLMDIGGGSSELVIANGPNISAAVSIPIGALKLNETVSEANLDIYKTEASRIIKSIVGKLVVPVSTSIIATGGTITSAAAINMGTGRFDSRLVHGSVLTAGEMLIIAGAFESADLNGRRQMIPFDPERAELILPGLAIFLCIMDIISRDSLTVSSGGIRYGAALHPGKILP